MPPFKPLLLATSAALMLSLTPLASQAADGQLAAQLAAARQEGSIWTAFALNRHLNPFKLDIEVVRGEGYVYFELADYDIPSIYVNPTSISTSDLVRLVWNHLIDSVADWSK